MELIVCSVRDEKSEAFGAPFFTVSLGSAVRSFSDEANRADERNMVYNHPDDFTLYTLGKFNDATGEFNTELPKYVIKASETRLIADTKKTIKELKVSKV